LLAQLLDHNCRKSKRVNDLPAGFLQAQHALRMPSTADCARIGLDLEIHDY